jgi:hypothetical protein
MKKGVSTGKTLVSLFLKNAFGEYLANATTKSRPWLRRQL